MSEFDSPWKEALDVYFEAFIAFFYPKVHAEVDWSRGYETLDKELEQIAPQAETGRRVVDKLVKVWRKSGEEEWVLVHIEVQSQQEAEFALRMFVYHYRLLDRYNKTVVSLAVLGDDQPAWRPNRFHRDLWDCRVEFEFPIVKLLDYTTRVDELEVGANPFSTVVLAHIKAQETRQDNDRRFDWKLRLIRGLYERGMSREDIRQLFRFIDWMMDLPRELDRQFKTELENTEQEHHMPYVTSVERLAKEEGIQEGIREGIKEGIEKCLELRFSEIEPSVLEEIQQIQNTDLLNQILNAIKTVSSVDELRQLWKANQQTDG